MSKVIIIADDLTGANATSALLAEDGFKAATFLNLEKYDSKENSDLCVVSISTDSRAIESADAYERVKKVVNFFKDENISLFAKRIDSTLRGNIGYEIDGVLDNLSDDTYAIVVPSFPSSGRICVGGYLMVNQVPLEKTDVAKDPKTPILTSSVVEIIKKQTKKKIGFIGLGKVLEGVDSLKKAILKRADDGCKIIVIDATTDEDISQIAKSVKDSKLKIISVDPGPFTAAVAKEIIGQPSRQASQKIMLTVGSVSNLTRKQLEELKLEYAPLLVEANAMNFIQEHTHQVEVDRVVDLLLAKIHEYDVIGVVTTSQEEEVLNLKDIASNLKMSEDDVSQRISNGLAEVTSKLLKETDSLVGGLFTSGGDVTVAVCNALESAGIEIKDEVLPLAVYGRLIKGPYNKMPIITKGGLIGSEKAIIKCVDYLSTKLSTEYHSKN